MIKITDEIEKQLMECNCDTVNIGFYNDFGAVIGNAEFVIYYEDNGNGPYLAHISEFEQDGIFIRLKKANKSEIL